MSKKRILITGVSGLLGNNLAFDLKDKYEILGLYNTHEVQIKGTECRRVNMLSEEDVCAAIDDFKPEVIIHCAAISEVDYAQTHQELAYEINVAGTKTLVDHIKDYGTKFIYISTDSVYGNLKSGAMKEDCAINPANYYGSTKYQGEQEALKRNNTLIARTNFFGWNVQDKFSLSEWVIHELSHGKTIQGFHDVYFSSLYTFELAKLLDTAICKDLAGIYNFASSSSMSKYEFAIKLAGYFNLDKSLVKCISIDQFHLKAKRWKNLKLDASKMTRDLNCSPLTMEESIKKFYEDYKSGLPEKIKKNHISKTYPHLGRIPYGRQSIDKDDIQSVVDVLKSSNLTQGPKIVEFEGALAETIGARFSVVVNSGTSALHIACLSIGIGPGDEVITSPNTFVASANCIVYCGAKPVFADIDLLTYNISPQEIQKKINEKTKAIIPVHFAGQSCDMQAIKSIAETAEKKYGHKIYIIEDAAHTLGSYYKKTKVGSCAYSDMAIMSFHPVKHITTAEGGAVLTNNEELQKKLRCFRSHGITGDPKEFTYKDQAYEDGDIKPWYHEQNFLGHNYRTTDIQCALGLSQLKKLKSFIKRRREIVNIYNKHFKSIKNIQIPYESPDCANNFHLYVLLFDFEKIGITRSHLMAELKKQGIQTQVHYIPVHTQPFYQKNFNTKWGDHPSVESYYQRCLSIPLYPAMTDIEVRKVINEITNISKG